MAIEEKDRDDVMDRLLQLGGDKKFLSYDDLNRELPENVVSPDDIEDVLQKLEGWTNRGLRQNGAGFRLTTHCVI